ncbi:thiamine phosphate synthase [Maricaulis sp.]|uniref:thiamine phosphate synthase n=1 Tax=Maricaulis sp. TaxID=1486257 RepID=UPI003A90D83F
MTRPYDAQLGLARLAERVRGRQKDNLPALFALTDPVRTPDPIAFASALAPGTGLVYRHYGAASRVETALALARIADELGLYLFISGDAQLADHVDADGIHWPERMLGQASSRRMRGDTRVFTASVHSAAAAKRARRAGVDALFHSTVFASQSATAGRPHGIFAAAALAQSIQIPVFPLGGVNARTGRRLCGLGFAGFACVGALSEG